ncbi:hypothetical protein [Pigmentiphaga daeguensis]|uniref:Uncharacterized protein n=1 Tax=Pigmentiphaga daeguensis TaxID=414049 RepID=A0ABP3N5D0_9BURK
MSATTPSVPEVILQDILAQALRAAAYQAERGGFTPEEAAQAVARAGMAAWRAVNA